jgi:hypothetical protein
MLIFSKLHMYSLGDIGHLEPRLSIPSTTKPAYSQKIYPIYLNKHDHTFEHTLEVTHRPLCHVV